MLLCCGVELPVYVVVVAYVCNEEKRGIESGIRFILYDVRYIKQNHVESINPLILSSCLYVLYILYLVAQ